MCIAKLTYKNEAYSCVVINNNPSSPAIMAIQSKPEVNTHHQLRRERPRVSIRSAECHGWT
ncbi:hypothetical protein BDR06DRAFT_183442 [Suillus hirtellus]|nr:hypothetical protein BDR06DRAFT_183442 [Suillus hirtellus]